MQKYRQALLERAKVTPEELDKIYVAGQFGYHLNPDILLNLGLLPPVAPSRLHNLGNTALKGALKALCDDEVREHFMTIGADVTTVSLSMLDNYDRYFIEASNFPNNKR